LQEGQAWGLNPRGKDARNNWLAGIVAVREVLSDGMESGEFLPGDPDLLAPTLNAVLQVQLAGLIEKAEAPDPEVISVAILATLRRMLAGSDGDAAPSPV
jgi:hypothetical protein